MTITILGDAFIDITVPVGRTNPGETHVRNISFNCGGTANVSHGITQLGEKAGFLGKIGNDIFGKYFKNFLKDSKIKDITIIDKKHATGVCISMVNMNGERTMLVDRGANDFFVEKEYAKKLPILFNSEILYVSGYSLQSHNNVEVIEKILNKCQKKNIKIFFNPGAPNIITQTHITFLKKYADILILNFDEARKITNATSRDHIVKKLTKFIDTAVITCGSEGCLLVQSDLVSMINTPKINALDTTGAGDAFSSGFIVGLIKNHSLVESCEIGNEYAGNIIVQKTEAIR
jgi:ribokinase